MVQKIVVYHLTFLLFLSVSISGWAQETVEDSLCALWFNKCATCLKSQQFNEAEKYIVAIEKTSSKEVFVEVAKYCRMNLAFHKATERYQHGKYDEALAIATDGLQYLENKRAKPRERFFLPKVIADCLIHKGAYEDARSIYEGLHQQAVQYGLEEIAAESLNWIASSYQKLGNYEDALKNYKQAYELLYQLESPKTKYAASGLKRLYKYRLYNQEKADYWAKKEIEAEKFTRKRTLQYNVWTDYNFASLANMKKESLDDFKQNKKQVAIDLASRWIDGAEEVGCKDSILLAEAYWWRSTFYNMGGKNSLALKDLSKSLKLIGDHKDENRELLFRIWNMVSVCYSHSKLYEKSISANKQAILNASIVYGNKSLEVARQYYNLSRNEYWQKKYLGQINYFCTYSNIIRERIASDFDFLNKQERAAYWQRLGQSVGEMPKIIFDYGVTNDSYADSLYNLVLFSKGLLLNAEIEEKYKANAHNDYMFTSVDDIRRCLSRHSAAIEFCESRHILDTTICALIVSGNTSHAQLVKLGKKKDIRLSASSLSNLYKNVWAPLEPYLNTLDTVYFSPASALTVLPLESALLSTSKHVAYRLSSTRHLTSAKRFRPHPVSKVALFGGIDYDMLSLGSESESTEHRIRTHERGLRGAIGTIEPLPNTKKEAEQIRNVLEENNIQTICFFDNKGTEEAFKSLGTENYSVIHIATHGFYTPQDEQSVRRDYIKELREGDINLQKEWLLLQDCGLLMAGAQQTLWGENDQSGENDGLLTALEISSLNLDSLNLVSLSACQTGQGVITGDGVFGLQRGFKKAGVQSILMSLWNVDDEATCLLMTEFFKNWISEGKSKHDALEFAKQVVRSHKENGWDDPKYWAAFILLDALD